MIWRCVICYVFVALTLKSLLSQINFAHSRSPDFRLVCGIDGCTKEYRVYNSFWYHVRRTHSQYLDGGRSRSLRRERSVHEASSNHVWADSGPTLVAQEAGNSSNSPDNGMTLGNTVDLQPSLPVPVEHFGAFDTGETVFSGLNSNSGLPSPQNLEIQDALNETSDSNPTLLVPNRPSDDSCSSSLPKETTNDELSSDDVLSRHATAVVMTAREKHHLSQSGVNDVVAAVQEYQAQLLNSLRSQLQTVFNRHSENTYSHSDRQSVVLLPHHVGTRTAFDDLFLSFYFLRRHSKKTSPTPAAGSRSS
ncbi:hypothetical protein G5714_009756 [Onychostoma macrolepis]|uniref:C2H2-type domain-containing protein n=1 Tax=Onychostoma macrolepis TaxID=369639 RepID=A0A7J6CQ71_9TELE|nr:hypothetical protein G5714_009756 [Onychostoma macrolepis]